MKGSILTGILAASLFAGSAAFADTPRPPAGGAPPEAVLANATRPAHPDKQAFREQMMMRLQARLELTDAQQKKLDAIMASWHATMEQRRDSFKKRFMALLTPQQQATVEQMHQAREKRRQERREKHPEKSETAPGTAAKPDNAAPGEKASPSGTEYSRPRLNLTADQMKQARTLFNERRHQMRADRELMLVQTSAILSPLQEQELERMLPGGEDKARREHGGWSHEGAGWEHEKGARADACEK